MIVRPLTPYDATSARVLSDAHLETIRERRAYIFREHQIQWPLPGLSYGSLAYRSLEGGLWYRDLSFAKIALLSRGATLLDHWEAIKRERDLPVSVLAWQCSEEALGSGSNWESIFYRTLQTEDQDEGQRRLSGDTWTFSPVADVPGFSAISNQEALYFYRRVGGVLPHVEHINFETVHIVTGPGRPAVTHQVVVDGGVTPYVYRLIDAPEWITLGDTGLLRATPGLTVRRGVHAFTVEVTDANGLRVNIPAEAPILM